MTDIKHTEIKKRIVRNSAAEFLRSYPTIPIIILMIIGFSVTTKNFLNPGTVRTMMAVNTVALIAAIGETFVLLTGGIDLSVATVISVSAVISATLMEITGANLLVGIVAAVAVGLIFGTINGILIGYGKMTPFITTMGTNLVARGIAFMMSSEGRGVKASKELIQFGFKTFLGVPLITWIGLILIVVFTILLKQTFWGRRVILTGSNRTAAKYSGINTAKTEASVYILSGLLAGIAGFISIINLGAGIPGVGDSLLLIIIAAVVLGGTSMTGGEGSVMRTLIGIILLAVLTQGLDRLHVEFYDQYIVMGILIFIGNSLTIRITSRSSKAMH
ncbi:MAG: ABC transporter permease [Spirochaetales bacterium]|uniref:ABC transporter permease n=1 Tax=Candidatus Thalassospirochaeta sargassi TaxID=3119039 RepID=A0AAJ1IGP2_9SPIO|nr:ABC transporter permease [Spirochaetales bacterium]